MAAWDLLEGAYVDYEMHNGREREAEIRMGYGGMQVTSGCAVRKDRWTFPGRAASEEGSTPAMALCHAHPSAASLEPWVNGLAQRRLVIFNIIASLSINLKEPRSLQLPEIRPAIMTASGRHHTGARVRFLIGTLIDMHASRADKRADEGLYLLAIDTLNVAISQPL
ncbi:hypothetical protein P154DRAFT_578228 [Amniculicola lignicola CBS 123094]|uniref:Uncharacterized protein n=1 Tax=Amniculicola lignicola CBS 123094 TaxID=1392246 RepID=A0A6A5WDG1_9PLEO|nr:hypothetical protein P154DRAFT_578228 [Amniculicola lignicola CBS 123094]